jgi:hypothetical protein
VFFIIVSMVLTLILQLIVLVLKICLVLQIKHWFYCKLFLVLKITYLLGWNSNSRPLVPKVTVYIIKLIPNLDEKIIAMYLAKKFVWKFVLKFAIKSIHKILILKFEYRKCVENKVKKCLVCPRETDEKRHFDSFCPLLVNFSQKFGMLSKIWVHGCNEQPKTLWKKLG